MWPGVISAICFALFFLGHYLAGLAGWEVVGLFILGMILVLIEILFFAHSTIVFGLVGVFLIVGSLLWTMIDRYPQQPFLPTGKKGCCGYRSIIVHSSDPTIRKTPTSPKTMVLCAKKSISISTRIIPRMK